MSHHRKLFCITKHWSKNRYCHSFYIWSNISRKLEFGALIPKPLVELRLYLLFFWMFMLQLFPMAEAGHSQGINGHCLLFQPLKIFSWIRLTVGPPGALFFPSVLFLSKFLMFLGMAILRWAAWNCLQNQQDGNAMLCRPVKVSTLSELSVTERVLCSTELKKDYSWFVWVNQPPHAFSFMLYGCFYISWFLVFRFTKLSNCSFVNMMWKRFFFIFYVPKSLYSVQFLFLNVSIFVSLCQPLMQHKNQFV